MIEEEEYLSASDDADTSADIETDSEDDSDVVFLEDAPILDEPTETVPPLIEVSAPDGPVQPRRSERQNRGRPPSHLNDYQVDVNDAANRVENGELDPKSFKQAISSSARKEWINAMQEELASIEACGTWTLEDLPVGRKAVGSKWVFKTKHDENGSLKQRKARLIAQEFSQKYGVDFDEVFAPVARGATLRLLLSEARMKNRIVKQYDIKTAFLNGTLTEEIFMKPPPGIETGGKVYRLRKSLYGLKQAARVWNQTLDESLNEMDLNKMSLTIVFTR